MSSLIKLFTFRTILSGTHSQIWRFIVFLTIYRHFDDLSSFWRFIVILTIYRHFDDL